MKRCPKCGAACPRSGQKFCSHCGAPLTSTPPQAGAGWPPAAYVRRRHRIMAVAGGILVVVVLALLGVFLWTRRGSDAAQPAAASVTAESAPAAVVEESNRLYLENLMDVDGMKITANGQEIGYGMAVDGRLYVDRTKLTETNTLLRAILPVGQGYQTTLALVSRPTNSTASFGTLSDCDAEGYNQPDASYIDAMVSVYYQSLLSAYNSRQTEDLRFSSELNTQSLTEAITMGAYDAVQYDLNKSDMAFNQASITYGDHKVTLNVAGLWTGVNRQTGEEQSGTEYMTLQAIWRDGMWQVDRCTSCTEEEYNNGTLKLSSH